MPTDNIKEFIPYSQDAEEALLGSILINPNIIDEITLEDNDWYILCNRSLWKIIKRLWNDDKLPDIITIANELKNDKIWNDITQNEAPEIWLNNLINATPSSIYAFNYADIIADKSKRRKLFSCAEKLKNAAIGNGNTDKIILDVIDEIAINNNDSDEPKEIKELVDKLYNQVEERSKNPSRIWGIPTGFGDYDNYLGGIHKGEVVYIAGAPGIGKSILANQIGINAAMANHPGAVFSLEMQGMMVARRIVSSVGKIETRKLKSGELDEGDWDKFVNACEDTCKLPIYICDKSDLTTNELHSYLSRLKAKAGIEWFILDYLMLVGDPGKDDNERSATISRRIISIAKKLDLAGITVNSVTKEIMDGIHRPTQKNIRGSGSIVHDANVVVFLVEHEPKMGQRPNSSMRSLLIEKVRDEDCPHSIIDIMKTPGYPGFTDIQTTDDRFLDWSK
jgi:replicative DNA helicase